MKVNGFVLLENFAQVLQDAYLMQNKYFSLKKKKIN